MYEVINKIKDKLKPLNVSDKNITFLIDNLYYLRLTNKEILELVDQVIIIYKLYQKYLGYKEFIKENNDGPYAESDEYRDNTIKLLLDILENGLSWYNCGKLMSSYEYYKMQPYIMNKNYEGVNIVIRKILDNYQDWLIEKSYQYNLLKRKTILIQRLFFLKYYEPKNKKFRELEDHFNSYKFI